MRTVTLELPEDLADRLEAMTTAERNHFAIAAIADRLSLLELEDADVDDALRDAVNESLADLDAGKGRPLEAYQTEQAAFWAKHGL